MESLNSNQPKVDSSIDYMNLQGLNDLRQKAREDERAALRPVAEQFEALFLNQILKESRKVSFDDGWLDGKDADFFKDWHDKQLSQNLSSKGSLGLADKIVEQLAPQIGLQANSIEEAEKLIALKRQAESESNSVESASSKLMTQNALQARPFLK
ncbi:rod-binding protein [Thiomicrorhabdus indica]|uniref:rod-binding protein n=1 Tax=Thiomicrorhabdus indica TaxID=2267253 RepID=UPI002AA758A8|nr:rod-binding protein [Thiomicrorhabdus indica]